MSNDPILKIMSHLRRSTSGVLSAFFFFVSSSYELEKLLVLIPVNNIHIDDTRLVPSSVESFGNVTYEHVQTRYS